MKTFLRSMSLLLALLMLLAVFATMVSCGEDPAPDNGGETPAPDEGGEKPGDGGSEVPTPGADGKAQYTITVKTIGGRPVSNLSFYIYKGTGDNEELKTYGKTDANGVGTVKLEPANDYSVELDASSLDGYNVAARYTFSGSSTYITLTSSVIADSDLTGVSYKVGDIIRDFTVTTTDGEIFKLSEVLKDKKGVLINFWYSTCSPCISEFPYMQSAYEKYSDDIAVIALNNYPSDTVNTIKEFKLAYGIDLPMAKENLGIGKAFGVNAYPTSIFVDRYGTICLIEVGSLPSERPFTAAFEHFSADDYQQQLFTSIGELTPVEKPDVEMPSSDVIGEYLNGEGFTATYYPETGTSDAEYSWPFLTDKVDDSDRTCVYPSNSFKESSFATMHADVYLEAGQALAIDWFASTEVSVDILYILVNGKDIYRISGVSTDWTTCYPYVATQSGTYKITFIYLKDADTDVGQDCVLLSNFRTVKAEDVDCATYIPREAATNPNANGLGFQNYVNVVFNANDGYYHVNTVDGPILLVNLMGDTQLSETSLNDLGYNGKLTDSQGDIYVKLVDYCNYAINGTLYGYCPVTAEMYDLLKRAAEIVGFERGNENQWLQACSYYDAYGTTEQLEDPVRGIAFFAAIPAYEGTATEPYYNTVTYDGRVIMPRGLKYKFVPTKSGAYVIKSQSTDEVDGWLFDENGELIYTAAVVERPIAGSNIMDAFNISMTYYMEAGKTYYIDIAYYDVYAAGTFTFTIQFVAAQYQQLHLASPAYFTFLETTTGQIGETIAGGIEVVLGDDGYYHELRANGTLGSIVYADFAHSTGLFETSLEYMIRKGSFNFSLSETDQNILSKLNELGGDKDACRAFFREYWGDEYDQWADVWQLEEVLAGITHGEGEDLTDAISAYLDKLIDDPATPELKGCVAVDATLAALLQKVMDKYTFPGVRNSWTKLCYYYKTMG